jgi:hypothetical protein
MVAQSLEILPGHDPRYIKLEDLGYFMSGFDPHGRMAERGVAVKSFDKRCPKSSIVTEVSLEHPLKFTVYTKGSSELTQTKVNEGVLVEIASFGLPLDVDDKNVTQYPGYSSSSFVISRDGVDYNVGKDEVVGLED